MGLLTKDEIFGMDDLPSEIVVVPEWQNREVRVRVLPGTLRDEFETSCAEDEWGSRNFRARLCALCLVDEAGRSLFTLEEAERLGQKSGQALGRIFEVAARLNGIGKKAQEQAEKNSATAPSGASG